MLRRFRIGPPKMHRRFRIGLLQVSLNLLPQEFHSRGVLLTIAIMKEKQQKNLFEIEWQISRHLLTMTVFTIPNIDILAG